MSLRRRIGLARIGTIAALATAMACSASVDDTDSVEGNATAGDDLSALYTGLWTNWWRGVDANQLKAEGLLKLLKMREVMTQKNLFDTDGPNGANLGRAPSCNTEEAKRFRTMDGTCNDLKRPTAGAAGAHMGRNVPLDKAIAETEATTLMTPNPRQISVELLARDTKNGTPVVKEVDFLNLTAASWIQFQTHDWFAHPQQSTETYKVAFGGTTLYVRKGVEDPHKDLSGVPFLKTFKNENTHWWDGSQLYGSDEATAKRLRSDKDGKLVAGGMLHLENGNLPRIGSGKEAKEDSGFTKNWWVGLSMLHTLFAREHNYIAAELKKADGKLTDDQIFQLARMINAAVMAKVHTVEWTPAILKNATLNAGMNANWNGIKEMGKPAILGSPMNPDLTKVPYSLTEEFTSVYRLHSLLPEQVVLRSLKDGREEKKSMLDVRHGLPDVDGSFDMTDLFYSFGQQHPGQLTLHNFPKFLQDIEVEFAGVQVAHVDVGTNDIIRDRERGVPRYNEFRRQLQLKPITRFDDLVLPTPDAQASGVPVTGSIADTDLKDSEKKERQRFVTEIRRVYGTTNGKDNVEKLDLLVGCLAEQVRPNGFGFGETQFQIFILMASRRLQADRFYTDDFNEKVYTRFGIDHVKGVTMKQVLLRHFPELGPSLAGVEAGNAFFPWKSDPRATPRSKD